MTGAALRPTPSPIPSKGIGQPWGTSAGDQGGGAPSPPR